MILFKPPAGAVSIRGGFDHATAGSDVFGVGRGFA